MLASSAARPVGAVSLPAEPSLLTRIWRARRFYVYLAPTFLLLAVFQYFPPISGFYHSFFSWNARFETFVGLDNYVELMQDRIFRVSLVNMLQLTAFHVFQNLSVPLLVAELLFNLRSARVRYAYQLLTIVPLVVPLVLTLLIWQFIYDPGAGLLNALFAWLGLGSLTSPWLYSSKTALYALMFIGFPWLNPIAVFIYLAGLMNISDAVLESARLDGAEGLTRFLRIDLPLIMSQIKRSSTGSRSRRRPSTRAASHVGGRAWWKGIYSVDSPRTRDQWRLTAESLSFLRPGFAERLPPNWFDHFRQGKIGLVQLYGANARDLEFDSLRKFEYAVWPMPKASPEDSKYVPGSIVSPWATGNAGYSTIWNVTNTATKKGSVEACVDWLMYIIRPGPAEDIVNELGAMVPGVRGTKPNPYLGGYANDMDRLTTDPNFKDVHAFATRWQVASEYGNEMNKTVQQVGLREMTPDQAVDFMSKTFERVAADLIKVNGWDTAKWGARTPYPAGGRP